jgi:hypothetical protein
LIPQAVRAPSLEWKSDCGFESHCWVMPIDQHYSIVLLFCGSVNIQTFV